MVDFLKLLSRPEYVLYVSSEFIFVGVLALQLFGLGGDGDYEIDGDIDIDYSDLNLEIEQSAEAGTKAFFDYPIMIMLMFFFATFGIVGIASSEVLATFTPNLDAWKVSACGGVFSAVVCYSLSVRCARGFSRLMRPGVKNYAAPSQELIGTTGTVLSSAITSNEYARISVTGGKGNIYTLRARLVEGEKDVAKGGIVEVVSFEASSQSCECRPV
jgi:hypothetical protein